jgi:hypothetical protein
LEGRNKNKEVGINEGREAGGRKINTKENYMDPND